MAAQPCSGLQVRLSSYGRDVSKRTPTETLFGIVALFVQDRTWSQAALARELEVGTETIRNRMRELTQKNGFKFERQDDHPQVYWSVPKHWFPGVLPFTSTETADLLRLLGRARRSDVRDRLMKVVVSRLSNFGTTGMELETTTAEAPVSEEDEERWLTIIEDAIAKKKTVKMRYFTASRGRESWRHVSVHQVDSSPRPQFIATCHKADALRRFRLANVLEARLDLGEKHRPTTKTGCSHVSWSGLGMLPG